MFWGTGILGTGYESIVDAVQVTRKYGQSVIFDLGSDPRAGTRPWEVAEWLFSDDGTESEFLDVACGKEKVGVDGACSSYFDTGQR